MFGVSGTSELATNLQHALLEAARRDDFGDGRVHKDGWGFAFFSEKDLRYFRTMTPIFEDESALGIFNDSESTLQAIIHARHASPNEPVRQAYDAHPYSGHAGNSLFYLSHNGFLDKKPLAARLGMDTSQMSDSEAFTYLLEHEEGSFEERFQAAVNWIQAQGPLAGALNLIALLIPRNSTPRICYYSDYPETANQLYYSLYEWSDERGRAVMSSTVTYKAGLIDREGKPIHAYVKRCQTRKLSYL